MTVMVTRNAACQGVRSSKGAVEAAGCSPGTLVTALLGQQHWGLNLHQAPGAAGVAAPVQQGARWAVLVRVVVGGWGWGQRGLVDDLDWGAWATQGCGAAGVRGGRGVAGESLA